MLRNTLIITLYLLAAIALETVLQQFRYLPPAWLNSFCELRLLALGGILIGLLRGEEPGMVVAAFAALLLGLSEEPGLLGVSIVSFTTAAFLGGMLARRVRLTGGGSIWFYIFLLLVILDVLALIRETLESHDIAWRWVSLLFHLAGAGYFGHVRWQFRRLETMRRQKLEEDGKSLQS